MTRTPEIKLAALQTVRAPSGEIRYRATGGGTPVLLLHAFPLSSAQWQPQLASPPDGIRLIAPDLRGFRGPDADVVPPPASPLTLTDYAADVVALMDALDIDAAGVCGLSMGGYVAFAMLRIAPRRISRLILANTRATADTAAARESRDAAIALARRDGASAIADEMLPKLLGETTRRDAPAVVATVRALIEANDAGAIVAALEALKIRPDSTALLGEITCETTIVHGAEDTIIPIADAEAMHAGIDGSRLVILPRAGHLSNLEAPDAFTRCLGTPR